jgi:vacuolar protein sorting-associated protein 35
LKTLSTHKLVLQLATSSRSRNPSILTTLENPTTAKALAELIQIMPFKLRHLVGKQLLQWILEKQTCISSPEHVQILLGQYLNTLVKDQPDGGLISGTGKNMDGEAIDMDDWASEQYEFAKLFHLLVDKGDNDRQLQILITIRKHLAECGPDRVRHLIPPLITNGLLLARRFSQQRKPNEENEELEGKMQGLFKFLHQSIVVLQKADQHEPAFKAFLLPLQDPSILVGFEMIAYEFVVQAFTIYEECISDSKRQVSALQLIIGTLLSCSNTGVLGVENYDTLITKTALYASRLLKKSDQCRMVLLCSHLFWGRDMTQADLANMTWVERKEHYDAPAATDVQRKWCYRDGKRVLECLQKSLKIADASMDALLNVQLFIEILNVYIYFYQKGNPAITTKYVNGLLDLIYTNLQGIVSDPSTVSSLSATDILDQVVEYGRKGDLLKPDASFLVHRVQKYFQSTLQHIANVRRTQMSGSGMDRWESVAVDDMLIALDKWTIDK